MAQCELFSPIAYPMLIEPNDWTNERHGGYLLNEIRMCHDLVRRGDRTLYTGRNTADCSEQDSEGSVYTLNPFTRYEVAKHLMEKGV